MRAGRERSPTRDGDGVGGVGGGCRLPQEEEGFSQIPTFSATAWTCETAGDEAGAVPAAGVPVPVRVRAAAAPGRVRGRHVHVAAGRPAGHQRGEEAHRTLEDVHRRGVGQAARRQAVRRTAPGPQRRANVIMRVHQKLRTNLFFFF